mgnify:CR=1 FL=1
MDQSWTLLSDKPLDSLHTFHFLLSSLRSKMSQSPDAGSFVMVNKFLSLHMEYWYSKWLFTDRYQYNPNAPGAASQLRLTPTGDLNMNISVSNINMIFQAYASWNSLSQVHESYTVISVASATYSSHLVIGCQFAVLVC